VWDLFPKLPSLQDVPISTRCTLWCYQAHTHALRAARAAVRWRAHYTTLFAPAGALPANACACLRLRIHCLPPVPRCACARAAHHALRLYAHAARHHCYAAYAAIHHTLPNTYSAYTARAAILRHLAIRTTRGSTTMPAFTMPTRLRLYTPLYSITSLHYLHAPAFTSTTCRATHRAGTCAGGFRIPACLFTAALAHYTAVHFALGFTHGYHTRHTWLVISTLGVTSMRMAATFHASASADIPHGRVLRRHAAGR